MGRLGGVIEMRGARRRHGGARIDQFVGADVQRADHHRPAREEGEDLGVLGHLLRLVWQLGLVEEQELGRIKKLSGAHLHRAWLNVPHVTQFDEADITELEAFRKSEKDEASKAGVKLTFMPFLMK